MQVDTLDQLELSSAELMPESATVDNMRPGS
jgi:hypothetical protein